MRALAHKQSEHSSVYSLDERLNDHQLSLAWAYLAELPDNPALPNPPLPNELKHLNQAEWYLVNQLLEYNLQLRDQLPLQ